jgi:hypothetical protein
MDTLKHRNTCGTIVLGRQSPLKCSDGIASRGKQIFYSPCESCIILGEFGIVLFWRCFSILLETLFIMELIAN